MKILKRVLIGILGIVIAVFAVRITGRLLNSRTPKGGINESLYVDITEPSSGSVSTAKIRTTPFFYISTAAPVLRPAIWTMLLQESGRMYIPLLPGIREHRERPGLRKKTQRL